MEVLFKVLSALGVVMAIIFGAVALFRNKKTDDCGDGVKMGQIMSDLGYLKSNTDDIKNEQREQRRVNTEMYSRLSAVEGSASSAHKRIDRIDSVLKEKGA